MRELVEKLVEIIKAGEINDVDISSIHTLAEDNYFKNPDVINDVFKSNVITCAMLLVRNPVLIKDKDFLTWIKCAIGMIEYMHKGSLSLEYDEPFNLNDALCTSIFYEYIKNIFTNDDILRHLSLNDYDVLFMFDYGDSPKDPKINDRYKALHFAQYLYIFVYNVKRVGTSPIEIAKILNVEFAVIQRVISYGERFGDYYCYKKQYDLMYQLIDLIKDLDNLDYENQIYKLFYFHCPHVKAQLDEFLFVLARHDLSKFLSEDLETLLIDRIKAKIKADKENEENIKRKRQSDLEAKQSVFENIHSYVLKRSNAATATRVYNTVMRAIRDPEITDVVEYFRDYENCLKIYNCGKKTISLIRQYLGIDPEPDIEDISVNTKEKIKVEKPNTKEEKVEEKKMEEKLGMEVGKRDHEKWLSNLSLFKEYISVNNCFPTNTTIYKEFNLGSWIRNQMSLFNRGKMPDLWLQLLNDVNPYWNGTKEEKEKESRRLLLSSDWKSRVPVGHTPIDQIYDDEYRLYYCLSHGVYDYKSLRENSQVRSYVKYDTIECLSKVIRYIDPIYTRLFCLIRGIDVNDLESLRKEVQELCVRTSEEMITKIDAMISTLTEREQECIRLRFGLDGGKCYTLSDCKEVFHVDRERIRQIEAKALRKLRHPGRQKVIYSTNTILDDIEMDRKTRARLYRLGIHTDDQLRELMVSDISTELREEIHYYFYPKYVPIEDEIKINRSIDDLDLSVRAYNAVRRYLTNYRNNYDTTVGSLVNVMENPKEFYGIRNLGIKCAKEIFDKVNDFLGTDMQLPEIPKN